MKTNLKALELIERGLSAKTVSKLTESQVEVLHSKLLNEAQVTQSQVLDLTADEVKKGFKVPDTMMAGKKNVVLTTNPKSPGGVRVEPTSEEVTEDDEVSLDPNKDTETQDAHQVGPSTNDGFNNDDDGMYNFESIEESEKYGDKNPWAICHAQVGPKKSRKFERCVKAVKKSLEEGKNPVSLFLEDEIMKIVERNLPPRITKGDLIKYLSEASPVTEPAPVKEPKEKPGTKEPPSPRKNPSTPGRDPRPKIKPAPQAISPEQAKNKIIDTIMQMLEK